MLTHAGQRSRHVSSRVQQTSGHRPAWRMDGHPSAEHDRRRWPALERRGSRPPSRAPLTARPPRRGTPRFAVLDDDIDVARSLAAGLVGLGFEVTVFATKAQPEAVLQFDSFVAYVIVSFLPNNTDEALVAELRSQSDTCPIQ